MIELPDLVTDLILDQLSYEDLNSLRVTCKKWREIVDQRPKSRAVHLFVQVHPFERKLFHTGELVGHANTYCASKPDILKSIKFRRQFNELLKLTIYFSRMDYVIDYKSGYFNVDLNDLNFFEKLVHLEIKNFLLPKNGKLSLANLRIGLFKRVFCGLAEGPIFELNCPQLKVLGLAWVRQPRLTQ